MISDAHHETAFETIDKGRVGCVDRLKTRPRTPPGSRGVSGGQSSGAAGGARSRRVKLGAKSPEIPLEVARTARHLKLHAVRDPPVRAQRSQTETRAR